MSLTLTREEIIELSGYEQPRKQLDALRELGFWRARLGRRGGVILERAHYDAVCRGAAQPEAMRERPKLRPARHENTARHV